MLPYREHCGGTESEHKFAFVMIFPRGNATKPKKFHFCPMYCITEGYFRHKEVPHFAKYVIGVIAIIKDVHRKLSSGGFAKLFATQKVQLRVLLATKCERRVLRPSVLL